MIAHYDPLLRSPTIGRSNITRQSLDLYPFPCLGIVCFSGFGTGAIVSLAHPSPILIDGLMDFKAFKHRWLETLMASNTKGSKYQWLQMPIVPLRKWHLGEAPSTALFYPPFDHCSTRDRKARFPFPGLLGVG